MVAISRSNRSNLTLGCWITGEYSEMVDILETNLGLKRKLNVSGDGRSQKRLVAVPIEKGNRIAEKSQTQLDLQQ